MRNPRVHILYLAPSPPLKCCVSPSVVSIVYSKSLSSLPLYSKSASQVSAASLYSSLSFLFPPPQYHRNSCATPTGSVSSFLA